jgi:redox-regulated HSP33 family molecular chaperone
MLVVECNSDLSMRATAKLADGAEIADDATLASMVNAHGHGRFAITLDPQDKLPGQQPYQGIVPLADTTGPLSSMTEVLEHYMQTSEQLDTRLWLAADDKIASGMLLQRLPSYGGAMEGRPGNEPAQVGETGQPLHEDVHSQDLDTWERVCQLGTTLRRDELLEQPIDTLIKRLYWDEMEHAAAAALPLLVLAGARGGDAAHARPGRDRRHPAGARQGGDRLRVLRPALRLRLGRLCAAVRAGHGGREQPGHPRAAPLIPAT